jgi:hypothetical protein
MGQARDDLVVRVTPAPAFAERIIGKVEPDASIPIAKGRDQLIPDGVIIGPTLDEQEQIALGRTIDDGS